MLIHIHPPQVLSGPTIMYEPEIKIFNSGGPSYVRTLKINNYLAAWLFGHGNARGVGEGGIQIFHYYFAFVPYEGKFIIN